MESEEIMEEIKKYFEANEFLIEEIKDKYEIIANYDCDGRNIK